MLLEGLKGFSTILECFEGAPSIMNGVLSLSTCGRGRGKKPTRPPALTAGEAGRQADRRPQAADLPASRAEEQTARNGATPQRTERTEPNLRGYRLTA